MRYTSSETSIKTERIIKVICLFITLAAAILVSLQVKHSIFRLQSISIDSSVKLSETAIYRNVPNHSIKYWPLFFIAHRNYIKAIESEYPVRAKLKLSNWGKFTLKMEPLDVQYQLFWNGKYWYISPEGKMWKVSLEENKYLDTKKVSNDTILYWGNDRATPLEADKTEGNVTVSSLPMGRIERWYASLEALKLKQKIKYMYVTVYEESSVVKLVVKNYSGTDGVTIILPDDPKSWVKIGLAIEKIIPDLQAMSSKDLIDATYQDKILVKIGLQ